ncbi:class I SAM-dependent methyltransferase [Rhizobium glycinendophyticum]|uniref:class I SAM-dependent methyltransferase n=1 Tax=Rhizobium glycinendophyticum TaxID=2589807 RepID=UPI0013755222|nr:class I SAM-dependent methyltransferase [Rhizobium glycinendophyticum]
MSSIKYIAKKISRRDIEKAIAEFATGIKSGDRVLNVGAGGSFAAILSAKLRDASVEIVSSDIDESRRPDVVDDITQSVLPDGHFDHVLCMEVLEHVKDPFQAAHHLRRILKPGGRLLLSTPYLFPTHDAPYDHFRYTQFGLQELFKDFRIDTLGARTSIVETVLLLCLRLAWLKGGEKRRLAYLFALSIALIYPLARLLGGGRRDAAFTSGFILKAVAVKNN